MDPKKINQQVAKINESEKQRLKTQKKADAQKAKNELKELDRLRKEGKKLKEALKQFHRWVEKYNIPTDWFKRREHWWKPDLKGWELLIRDSGDEWVIDSYCKTYVHLILLKSNSFRLATQNQSFRSDYRVVDVEDDSELGYFSLEELEKRIVEIVHKSGIPFE